MCRASRDSASGVDEWISQARKLHDAIARSRAIAREIVNEHETGKSLAAAAQDARAKVQLLSQEIEYNTRISNNFERLQHFNNDCQSIQATLSRDDVPKAAEDWAALQGRLETIERTNAKKIMEEQVWDLHKTALAQVEAQLDELFVFSREENTSWAQISEQTTMMLKGTGEVEVDVNVVLSAAEQLQAIDSTIKSISRDIERVLLHPVLLKGVNSKTLTLQVHNKRLEISEASSLKGVANVIQGVTTVLEYLHSYLPNRLNATIAKMIVPDTVSNLITEWLTECVPVELSEIPTFEELQTRALQLSELLKSYGWPGSQDLIDWTERAPRMWLTKRRMASLDGVRKVLAAERGSSKRVERVERQVLSKKEAVFATTDSDDWNNEWDDDDEKQESSLSKTGGEDDGNGWGFDEDESQETDVPIRSKPEDIDKEDDSAEAWGWDEDGAVGHPTESSISRNKGGAADSGPVNGTNGGTAGGRELTLKEEYTTTDVPDLILEIINKDVREASEVTDARYSILHGINPTNGLLALPTFVVAMFRATAPSYYGSTLNNGNMRLYNDCLYISERLRDMAATPQLVKLRHDCDSLEKFGKSAYAKEMDVQRTVLGDLLDGAQGFTSCTQFPYSTQCEEAVSSVVDRLKELHAQWRPILSHSALLQSIGSLLSRVIDKIVDDIEDMEDITEPESQRLTSFCNQVSVLSDLFVPEKTGAEPDGAHEAVPLTAVYVTTWLRFQYLINILDSSLIDIKYLWTDGELSLEFAAEEVVDLIRALFAESPNRREAISQIRRSKSRTSLR